jgi:cardiolipin synthase
MAVVFAEAWNRSGAEPLALAPLEAAEAGEGARVLVLDSRPARGHAESAAVLAAIVGAARELVFITNSYFAPQRLAVRILGAAARRGVDVRLLLPGRSDVPLVRHAGHAYFEELLEAGVRVYEYGAAVLHAKTLVADRQVSVVGSTNLDFLSFNTNAECNLVILDRPTGERMAAAFREDLNHSTEVRLESWKRSRLHRWGDGLARLLRPLL